MTEDNSPSTTDSLRESYLKKVNLEQVMKQVNMDLKLALDGQKVPKDAKRYGTLLRIQSILNMAQSQLEAV